MQKNRHDILPKMGEDKKVEKCNCIFTVLSVDLPSNSVEVPVHVFKLFKTMSERSQINDVVFFMTGGQSKLLSSVSLLESLFAFCPL